jgi:hypothetical protein
MAITTEQCDYLQEHLPYMLKMLRYTYGQMLQEQHYLSWNAHFESFAIHARNLTRFLSNKDKGNFKAAEFIKDYKARIGDESGPMSRLQAQVFHLAKQRPKDVVAKFDTEDAKAVKDWIEKNFDDFLSKLSRELRELFDEEKSNPEKDKALYISLGPTGPGGLQTACTASPVTTTLKVGC